MHPIRRDASDRNPRPMIPARKHRWFTRWFTGQARARLRRTFSAVRVRGLDALRELTAREPLVIVSNHTAWWDPLLVLYVVEDLLANDTYAMMNAKNLQRLPFFALVGAFGVDAANPADGASAMRYAARLLSQPRRAVWVFPQGEERPVTQRPLGFRAGSAEIARVAKCRVVPVGIRYEFRGVERPELLVDVGEPMAALRDVAAGREAQEAAVTKRLDAIDEALLRGDLEGFATVLAAPAQPFARVAESMLAWLTRPR